MPINILTIRCLYQHWVFRGPLNFLASFVVCKAFINTRVNSVQANIDQIMFNLVSIDNTTKIRISSDYFTVENYSVFDLQGVEHKLEELVEDGSKFIYEFTDMMCSDCIASSLEHLMTEVTTGVLDNTIIIASFSNLHKLATFYRVNEINIPVFQKRYDLLPNDNSGMKSPIFYLLDIDLWKHGVFVPNESRPEITKGYLQSIQRFFKRSYVST